MLMTLTQIKDIDEATLPQLESELQFWKRHERFESQTISRRLCQLGLELEAERNDLTEVEAIDFVKIKDLLFRNFPISFF